MIFFSGAGPAATLAVRKINGLSIHDCAQGNPLAFQPWTAPRLREAS